MSDGSPPTSSSESAEMAEMSELVAPSAESGPRPESLASQRPIFQLDTIRIADPIPLDVLMKLDENYPKVEKLGWWFLTSILGILLFVGWLIIGLAIRGRFDLVQWLLLIGVAVVVLLGMSASLFFPHRTFETTRWQLKENGIEIRRGIWWRHRIFVPHDRIQHTDVNQGPIARLYGIATLVINTGGTHEPSIPIEGLNLSVAEQLRALLSKSTTTL